VWLANYAGRSIGRLSPIGDSIADYPLSASAQPQGITAGPDGNVWFTEANSALIGRITPSGVATTFTAREDLADNPTGMTPGPDCNLGFTSELTSRIGRVTGGLPAESCAPGR
jgi:streptogramin lyase